MTADYDALRLQRRLLAVIFLVLAVLVTLLGLAALLAGYLWLYGGSRAGFGIALFGVSSLAAGAVLAVASNKRIGGGLRLLPVAIAVGDALIAFVALLVTGSLALAHLLGDGSVY